MFVMTFGCGVANATFIVESGGVVLDTTTGLEWLQDASSPTFQRNPFGLRSDDAIAYASTITLDGGGWRLPSSGEMQNLYFEISALTGCNPTCIGDQGPFTNIQYFYWGSDSFWFMCGPRCGTSSTAFSAWGVRADDGDNVSAVPEPETYTMMLAGRGSLPCQNVDDGKGGLAEKAPERRG